MPLKGGVQGVCRVSASVLCRAPDWRACWLVCERGGSTSEQILRNAQTEDVFPFEWQLVRRGRTGDRGRGQHIINVPGTFP